ncbi:MAG: MBL fold metallo-hydrolase [Gammaproteobacteria bacterium]|nr:MBL fold metallo-hydrolase [Gammaproteobacteria bacterium]
MTLRSHPARSAAAPALALALALNASHAVGGILNGEQALARVAPQVRNIVTFELQEQLRERPDTVLIDVRNSDEILLLGGMIDAPRIYNVSRGWLEFRMPDLVPDADTPIVVYCGINQRSPLAAATLSEMGYTDVRNYADGFFVWRDSGLPVEAPDLALDSMLYSKPQKVAEGVWSAIGATEPPSYTNSGHNNNLSFIITDDGVVVINASDNYLLARSLHEEIRKLTDQPVKYVVLENGQGHAAMGSAYWKEQGAHIIAHRDTLTELQKYGERILERVLQRSRDKGMGTKLVLPDEVFDEQKVIELGGRRIELLHLGPAHSPGDISVWLPDEKIVIAGDIAFHQRMLPVFEHTDTAAWVETWDKFEALGAEIVVPGHGVPTDMAEVTRYTRDYLVFMREQIRALMDSGGTLADVSKIDQSAYSHLDTYDELAALNASMIFRAMEFE